MKEQKETEVKKVRSIKGVSAKKSGRKRMKKAFLSGASSNNMMGAGGNYYSPELSTDFLELPQSKDEQRNIYRFFYKNDPFVGAAIDTLTELPLSKTRITKPKNIRDAEIARKATEFCIKWASEVKLLQVLLEISHSYHLLGEAVIYCEDNTEEMPETVEYDYVAIDEVDEDGDALAEKVLRPDADERIERWMKQHYKGWTAIRTIPAEQVRVESFPFTDEKLIEMLPDTKSKNIISKADQGDKHAQRIVDSMPVEVVDAIRRGEGYSLNTDPLEGPFVHILERRRSSDDKGGSSILQRCFLPGTPIWVKRQGIIQQIAVEDVVDQDLVLTHKGRFQKCAVGSREINETITALSIEGIQNPLKLTSEHKVLKVNTDGSEEWEEAQKLKAGDIVRESHIIPEREGIEKIDLVKWWEGRKLVSVKRGRPKLGLEETAREISVEEVKGTENLEVLFSYPSDDRNRNESITQLGQLLKWVHSLTEPVVMSRSEVAEITGLTLRDINVYAPRLKKEGLIHTERTACGSRGGSKLQWFPTEFSEIPKPQVRLASAIKEIKITPEFCYLLGTWLGDGCLWREKETLLNVRGIGWSLHEDAMREKVQSLLLLCFPGIAIQSGCLVSKFGHQGDIHIEDPLLARFFLEEFGYGCSGKHLPEWAFNLSEECALSLLQGLLDTDGWVSTKGVSLSISLKNKTLLDQIHLLASRLGLQTQVRRIIRMPSKWKASWETTQGTVEKEYSYGMRSYWILNCCRSEDVRKWIHGALKESRVENNQKGLPWKSQFVAEYLTRKVVNTASYRYQGTVYSLGVEEDESHVTGGIVTHNCLRTLTLRDKCRQALSSITSRHMTPYRIISAENLSLEQLGELRAQVDMAMADPDYSIITNYIVNWEERGSQDRIPDWSWVFEFTDRQLYAGLGVTESILSGESSYSGDRINLEVLNTRFMLFREILQDLVENYFFKPMCRTMGFVEEDEWGEVIVAVPRLSFTRLALRDNSDTFESLFNLYQKGSVDIGTILELLNLDPEATTERLLNDMFTVKDSLFNEALRPLYSKVGDILGEQSDASIKIAKNMGLKYKPVKTEEGDQRFGG